MCSQYIPVYSVLSILSDLVTEYILLGTKHMKQWKTMLDISDKKMWVTHYIQRHMYRQLSLSLSLSCFLSLCAHFPNILYRFFSLLIIFHAPLSFLLPPLNNVLADLATDNLPQLLPLTGALGLVIEHFPGSMGTSTFHRPPLSSHVVYSYFKSSCNNKY